MIQHPQVPSLVPDPDKVCLKRNLSERASLQGPREKGESNCKGLDAATSLAVLKCPGVHMPGAGVGLWAESTDDTAPIFWMLCLAMEAVCVKDYIDETH